MDFGFTEEQRMLRESVRKLLQKHAPPEYVRQHDRERTYPEELYQACAEAGLIGAAVPRGIRRRRRQPARHDHRRRGDRARLRRSGDGLYGQHLLRPQSRAQGVGGAEAPLAAETHRRRDQDSRSRCRSPTPAPTSAPCAPAAVRDGNQWVIDGQKIWASMAGAKNNVINLYVKTDPKAHYRQGMSLFLVDNDTPGLTLRKLDMLGRRATGTYELTFDNVRVPPDRLVGGENKGWDVRDVRPAGRARRVVRRQCRRRAGRRRSRRAIRQGPQAVRPPDRHQSGDRPHARRHGRPRSRPRAR